MSCKGAHCSGCGGRGTWLGVAVVVGVVLAGGAALRDAWPSIVTTVVIVGRVAWWTFFVLTAALMAGGLAALVTRCIRAFRPGDRTDALPVGEIEALPKRRDVPLPVDRQTRRRVDARSRAGHALPGWWELPARTGRKRPLARRPSGHNNAIAQLRRIRR